MAKEDAFHGAKVALFVGSRLLMLLRDDKPGIPYPDTWDFPGGGREGAETPFETLRREVQEEVALDLPRDAIIWSRNFSAIHDDAARVWFFVARLPAAAERLIALGDEGQCWRLVEEDAFLQMTNVVPSLPSRLRAWRAGGGLLPDEASG